MDIRGKVINTYIGFVMRQLGEEGADWKVRKSQKDRFVIRRLRGTGKNDREEYQQTQRRGCM